jgi:rRNA processing protein Krr1/Pno1
MNIKDTKIVLFSDDTNILLKAENGQILQQIINRVTTELHSWFYANSLSLSTEKTTAMPLHAWQERDLVKLQIKFGNIDIAYKSETKFLGIYISEYMKGH